MSALRRLAIKAYVSGSAMTTYCGTAAAGNACKGCSTYNVQTGEAYLSDNSSGVTWLICLDAFC